MASHLNPPLSRTAKCLNDDTSDLVRIGIRSRSSILEVTLAILSDLARDTNRTTTVSNTVAELIDVTGLVSAGQTGLVALTVDGDVLEVAGLELLHGGLDDLDTALLAHGLGGDVGVKTGTVPVAGDRLGVEGDDGAELFGDAVEKETGHPELVSD